MADRLFADDSYQQEVLGAIAVAVAAVERCCECAQDVEGVIWGKITASTSYRHDLKYSEVGRPSVMELQKPYMHVSHITLAWTVVSIFFLKHFLPNARC